MADILTDVIGSFVKRFKDMSDGSHAEVVDAILDTASGAGASIGTTADAAASSSAAEDTTPRTGIALWKGAKNILILINAKLPAALGAGGGLKIDGSGTALPVSGTFYQSTQPVSIDQTTPGTTNRVVAGGAKVTVSQTPTITAAGIYAAGDAVGGLLTFASAVRTGVLTGTLTKVVITDLDKEAAALDLVLFDRTFTPTADNAAFDPSDADLANCIGHIAIGSGNYSQFNDNAIATVIDQPLDLVLNGTSLFGQLVARGTPTYTAVGDISIDLVIQQD